jgi:hypothetical protein
MARFKLMLGDEVIAEGEGLDVPVRSQPTKHVIEVRDQPATFIGTINGQYQFEWSERKLAIPVQQPEWPLVIGEIYQVSFDYIEWKFDKP